MQLTVKFLDHWLGRDFENDCLKGWFDFSVIDSSLIGTPRERETYHTVRFSMTMELRENWGLYTARGSEVTEQVRKVAFQCIEDYVTELLKKGCLSDRELPPLSMNTKNSPPDCPYKLSNILYPSKNTFTVVIDNQVEQAKLLAVHPNIKVLINRMDDALERDDYSGVLHASASIFEPLAKDIIGIPTIQNQTLKAFFGRYRKDSNLPDEILDYILSIYDSRNTTPLAGHGSTQTPSISREAAVTLAEMTRAFINIEYRLRPKSP